jgi:hypothetical protein
MSENELFAENPIVATLLSTAGPNVKSYRGYVGPVEVDGYLSLYPDLVHLGVRFRIRKSDIVHAEAVPESDGPFGAIMVWVRPDGDITPHSPATDQRDALLSQANAATGAYADVVDRLNIAPAAEVFAADTCTSNCECVSNCDPCISICRWTCEPRTMAE